jgi:hypothetical protein
VAAFKNAREQTVIMAEAQQKLVVCRDCAGYGDCPYCDDGEIAGEECEDCSGTNRCSNCSGSGLVATQIP